MSTPHHYGVKANIPPLRILRTNVRRLRLGQGLTQQAAAEKGGFNYKYFQSLEAGRIHGLTYETIERLAALFRTDAWKLLHPTIIPETKIKKIKPKRIKR